MTDASARDEVEALFRRESAHLVAALVRLLGPAHVALAEDVVHDALVSALQAWSFEVPQNPKAWILQTAKHRAIDHLRRARRSEPLEDASSSDAGLEGLVETALSPAADAENQLAMMFAVCDERLGPETQVSLILRLLCGFSAAEIARAFLTSSETIDRRLHRGRSRLAELGALTDVHAPAAVLARQPAVERALYLLFNEGYHGSDPEHPLQPALCADAIRLAELLTQGDCVDLASAHALAALFCLSAARLPARLDQDGVFVPLAEQDRSRWDRALFERGAWHLAQSARGSEPTRWHLEAGIALEHTRAPSFEATDWPQILGYYDALLVLDPGPIVRLNHALALGEAEGLAAARSALDALDSDAKLANYSFFWAARADVERRDGNAERATQHYRRACELAKSRAELETYRRRLAELGN